MFKQSFFICTAAILWFDLLIVSPAHAQVTSWIAGQNQTEFGDAGNWTQGIPNINLIAAIGPAANAQNSEVILDNDRNVGGLLVSDGMILRTNNHLLNIFNLNGGGLTIAGSNILQEDILRRSRLIVDGTDGPEGTLIVNGNLRVLEGAALQLNNGARVRVEESHTLTVSTDSLIVGDGRISLSADTIQTLHNDGTIRASQFGHLTLQSNGIVDLDGASEAGILDASLLGSQITVLSATTESFDGLIKIGNGSTAEFESDGGGWSFGNALVELESSDENSASRFESSDITVVNQTTFRSNGHGVISGTDDPGLDTFTGNAILEVATNGSLKFDNTIVNLSGTWIVDQDAVLDFQDRLASANFVAAVLNGGTIKGEDSAVFNNTNPEGIRGHGRFELPLDNSTEIYANGGELVIVGTEDVFMNDNEVDWDGFSDTGALRAEAGDLRLVDRFDATTHGNVRIGGEHTLHVDGFRMQYDGNVLLNGGTIKSEDSQIFRGAVEVTRRSTMDTFAGFEGDVEVDLQMDLHLTGHAAFIENTAMFSGPGDLINESTNRLEFDNGSSVDVDVINHGIVSDENVEGPGIVSLGGHLENDGTIQFALSNVDESTFFDVAGNLRSENGIFRVIFVNDFSPESGDEFDLLDFGAFINNGLSFDLPDLCAGLQWDTSDFVSEGILRVSGLLLGDVNLDGAVDLLDVTPFIELVANGVFQPEADINQDGAVNLLDVAAFIDLLGQFCL